ncbi:MAG: hypothetical protein ACI9F9_002233 [Candidatus Paceibacteria bacterium]|jgi:hypothetical protein
MAIRMTSVLSSALILGAFGSLAPAFAQGSLDSSPSLRVLSGEVLIRGDQERPLLMLAGTWIPGTETTGRRVDPHEVIPVGLDPLGRFSFKIGALDAGTVLQVWQPPLAGASLGSGYSIPVTLVPAGSSSMSVAHNGDLLITEFMKDPTAVTDSHGEWIELRSNKNWRLDIEGLTISDLSGASFTLGNNGLGIFLAPGERFVIGNDLDPVTNGGVAVQYQWSSFSLKNSSDEIMVSGANGIMIDMVGYDDGFRWPDTPGMSISLTEGIFHPAGNNDPSLWCHSSSAMGQGSDTGTPGSTNDICP